MISFLKNKKGLSAVVATLILVLITIVSVSMIWVFIKGMLDKSINESEACFGNFDKVKINSKYTCYNSSSNEMIFSIEIGDISLDKVFVSVSGVGATKSIDLSNEEKVIPGLRGYGGEYGIGVKLPEKNAGNSYIFNLSSAGITPDSLKITPVIKGKQCDVVSDSLNQIDDCRTFI